MPSSVRDTPTTRELLAVRSLHGVGDIGVLRALRESAVITDVLQQRSAHEQQQAYDSADRMLHDANAFGARVLGRTDTNYPARLLELPDAPAVIFTKGMLPTADAPAVAIVGTRRATSYGIRVARAIATACARAGVAVVSGLAQGIDGAAHEAALDAGGRTVAVLGTGLDIAYPRRHVALQKQLARDGLVISELPLGDTGHAGTFPRRNRIIAALADLTVVVEAGIGSGALITADYAHALDRRIACVPNAIDVPTSMGSNALLKAFAEPILTPDDVLHMLSVQAQPTPRPILDDDAAACWDGIMSGAADVRTISAHAGLSVRATASALTVLELEGLVTIDPLGRVTPSIAVTGDASLDRSPRTTVSA